jgi:hypothetical protein
MLQPIDYRLNVQSPFEAAVSGFKLGAAGKEAAAQRLENEKARFELDRAQKNNAAVQALLGNPNATAQQYREIAATLPADQRKMLQDNFDALTKEEQSTQLQFGGQVMSALVAKKPDIAIELMARRAQAERNAGSEDKAKATESTIEMIKLNPDNAMHILGISMAGVPGFDKVLETATAAMKPPETKDPWVVVPGVGVFPRAQLERVAKIAEAEGSPDVTLTANIPDGAVEDLRAGRVSKATFDRVFGVGKADKILGVKNNGAR